MNEVDICQARMKKREEGDKQFPYNDTTGKRVTCKPGGNLSIGQGINLEFGLDEEERDWLTRHRLLAHDVWLEKLAWYISLDTVRKSVFLDISYNAGDGGLLHFPHLIAAAERKDWAECQKQCHVKNQQLDEQRYTPLGKILVTGIDQ
jgi:GH24 family phage-related lysozyme (muramidase)